MCFCSDDTDWRPLAAAINSTLQNAKRPLGFDWKVHFGIWFRTFGHSCGDDRSFRFLFAAAANFGKLRGPKLVTFHLITSPDLAPVVSDTLIKVLPVLAAQLKVHSSTTLQNRIKSVLP